MSRPAGPVMRSMTIRGGMLSCPRPGPIDSVVRTTGSDEPVNSVAVTYSADTVSVVTTGVAFQDKYDVPSGLGCDYDD